VSIRGGVGEATSTFRKALGIEADVKGGIGGIHAPGLEKRDGRYVNDSYGHAKTTVRLDIRGGIGAINLISELSSPSPVADALVGLCTVVGKSRKGVRRQD
jgi:hypothetical protein